MHRAIPHRLSAIARSAAALLAAIAAPSFASTQGVVISQVYGGNGNTYASDYVELFNASASAVTVSGWSIQYASASGTGNFVNGSTAISGTIQPGQYWLVKLATSTTGTALPTADFSGTSNLSGSAGKVALVDQTTSLACNGSSTACTPAQLAHIVDLVGYGSTANFAEGSPAPAPSNTTAIFRVASGCTDTDNNASDFMVGAPAPRNSATPPAPCASATPVPPPAPAPSPAPGPTLLISQIQGSGSTSPYVGQTVTTSGVVTKVNNNGFFLQSVTPDSDPNTSEGIFVFTSTAPTVTAGQLVQLTAKVSEFNVGATSNADTAAHTVTELGTITALTVLGTGQIPAPVVLQFPLATQDAMEHYEGMLVTLNGPLTVQQNYFLGRFGELTLGAGGRLWTPTNVYRPGAQAQALATDNIRRSILLDDGSTLQNVNPTPYLAPDNTVRAGDTVASITGVVDYGLTSSASSDPGAYKIHPTQPVTFTRANPRTTMAADVGGNVRIGSANIENFFTTLDDGVNKCAPSNTAGDCRGANSATEFTRQETKIVEELVGMNADAVALMEVQNNGTVAIQNLVNALNARLGGNVYAAVPDAPTGGGTDAIKVAMIYKPSRLALVGAAMSDTAAINNRAPMAQTFAAPNGEKFNLIGNHLKSKDCGDSTPGAGDADAGDMQGCFNGTRVRQADELRTFVARVQASSGVADTLMVGDFNAYAKEDPVVDLTSNGFIDQVGRFLDLPQSNAYGYSYVFNGTSGRLDQAVANNTLSPKVSGVTEWHINADEPLLIDYNLEFKQPACPTCSPDYYTASPYRASDHDPIVIGLNLVHAINGTSGADRIVGTPGDDIITGGAGADTLTGNGGRDVFVYTSMRDAADTITDFTPNDDRIDMSALLASIGVAPANAIAGGYVKLVASGNNTVVMVDTDGSAGPAAARPLVTLLDVNPASIDPLRDLGLGTPAAVNAAARASARSATLRTMTAAHVPAPSARGLVKSK
jgi:predicted extracellular nuclease